MRDLGRLAGVLAVTLLVAAGCAPGGGGEPEPAAGPRPVTVAESELLASVRFRNFDAGSRAIRATYPEQGHEVKVVGWFDYTTHTGYALVSTDGLPSDRIAWNGKVVAVTEGTRLGMPLRSLEGWQAGLLDPRTSPLAVVLTVVAQLGADRRENPLLIRQGGALWLREDTTDDDRPVTVFAGPTSVPREDDARADRGNRPDDGTNEPGGDPGAGEPVGGDAVDPEAAGVRYWVDAGGLVHRLDVRLGEEWARITMRNDDVPVPALLANVDVDKLAERSKG